MYTPHWYASAMLRSWFLPRRSLPLALCLLVGPLSLALAARSATEQAPPAQPAAKPPPISIVPAPRTDGAVDRQSEVVRRVREAKGGERIIFLGDSITQGWEGAGKDVWQKSIGPLGALNIGVSGDRTEHVLWRLKEAPLTSLAPKAIVVMIGTNNLGHGSSNAEETLLGVQTIVSTLRTQCPNATILLCGIFPRGDRFNAMRGDICQINQALRRMASDHVTFLDFGHRFLKDDGTIGTDLMPDHLHLSPSAYAIWAEEVMPSITKALDGKRGS